jgi:hypothetical protein
MFSDALTFIHKTFSVTGTMWAYVLAITSFLMICLLLPVWYRDVRELTEAGSLILSLSVGYLTTLGVVGTALLLGQRR